MDELEIIKLCQKGDVNAFNQLFKMYGSMAKNVAYLISGNNNLADDIVQESFIQCFNDIKRLKKPDKFKSWFYRIVVRNSWKLLNKEKKVAFCELNEKNSLMSEDNELCNEFLAKEDRLAVLCSLEKLSFPLKTTVILYYFNQLSVKEISKTLHCMQGTVKSRLHNARRVLHKELLKENIGFDALYGKEC